jgi:hypothetical protein
MVDWFEMEKFLLLWVKCEVGFICQKLGLLAIFGEFGKNLAPRPLPFSRILCKNLTLFLSKNYIGLGPTLLILNTKDNMPCTNNKHTSQCQHQTPKPALGSLHRTTLQSSAYIYTYVYSLLVNVGYCPQKIEKYLKLNFKTLRQVLNQFKGVQRRGACVHRRL